MAERSPVEEPPLAGVRVVDLASYIAGSYAAMMLADLGAAVVKVESREGDPFRELPGFFGWNRGKRSLAVDLKTPEGRDIVGRLAARSDVAVENMRPGVADRLGVGYAQLAALNPRLVYCSITAFGSSGPYLDRPGFDPLLQAMGGVMALQGFGGPPQYVRIAVSDYYAAALGAQAILAALFVRERNGRGQRVETSLLQAVLALQSGNVVDYPGKQSMSRDNPTYRLYQAGDGEWFFLACGNQTFWTKLCKALGLEPLADDPRFASWLLRLDNRDALLPILEATFRREPRSRWLEVLAAHDIPAAPVQALAEFWDDPAVRHHDMIHAYDHPEVGRLRLMGQPLLFSSTRTRDPGPPPTLGQHTDDVLRELGYDAAEGVATVTLNRPEVLNAMNDRMQTELTRCFGDLAGDDAVRVVVVTGAGERAFSAGADVREFVEPPVPVRFREHRRRLGLPEIDLAIIPGGGGTQRLPRLAGRGKALELTLAEALRFENDLATLLRTTEDRLEGARAFLEKRPPRWTGR